MTGRKAPIDRRGRSIDDLRISVIDRCNFRCAFCMPADREYQFVPRAELLRFEEIARLATIFARLGVRKLRLTGGEPLLRSELEILVGLLATIPGIEDLALTTNGALLRARAAALRDAGLGRVTVSLPSLDPQTFARLNGVGQRVERVIEGIDEASRVGLRPLRINTVVLRGVNDREVVSIARFGKERGLEVRFIEYMDVGTVNGWQQNQVLSAREILERVAAELPMEPLSRQRPSDTALRFRYLDDGVEVGAIASITEPFCGDCTRARLSSEGELFTCLFASHGTDLKTMLRNGSSDDAIEQLIRGRWALRADRYSEERWDRLQSGLAAAEPKIEMFRIGG